MCALQLPQGCVPIPCSSCTSSLSERWSAMGILTLLLQIVVVTEFAEGELYQILEDDRTLPLEQARLNVVVLSSLSWLTARLWPGSLHCAATGLGSPLSPLQSHHPPRHEAAEHPHRQGRLHQTLRLWVIASLCAPDARCILTLLVLTLAGLPAP